MYEQSERCNFKTIYSISSWIRVFSASLPAIASGKKTSAKRHFSDMAFSNVQAQTLVQTVLLSEYHSNKTNCYHWQNQHRVRTINTEYTGALIEISIKQNQSFPRTKLLHDQRAINKTTSINQTKPIIFPGRNCSMICNQSIKQPATCPEYAWSAEYEVHDKELWRAFHTDTLRKANHKSEGKSSTIGCQKVTNQGAELKSNIWRFRHSSYVVLLFDKRMAEARCLNQSFEFGSAERLSLLLDLILREQLTSTVVCIIYGCQRSTSWRHVYKHTFCIQTYILDWTSPLGLFRNNNSLVLMPDRMQILFHECDYV